MISISRSKSLFVVAMTAAIGVSSFLPAHADVPAAAQLLDQTANPYTSTGVRVTVSNSGSMYGLANDGTNAYIINSSGNVTTVPLASLAAETPGSSVSTSGTTHTVAWGSGSPAWPNSSQGSIAYSHGCIFMTSAEDGGTAAGSIDLYCIDISDWSVTEIAVPEAKPLPNGYYFAYSNLIDFPDGRIGKVSKYEAVGGGQYRSTLRTYTITGTGKNATLAWSEDIIMGDSSNWAVDEHGLGTDGTYLYRIQWKTVNPNTKVWELASGATSTIAYTGGFTQPFGNMHFLSHNHTANYYLVGHYSQNQFFITSSADPGPGPGNPLTPAFGGISYGANGFTVQVTNYDGAFSWGVQATAGAVSINGSGLITVTGLAGEGSASTVTATTTKTGYPNGTADVTGTLPDGTAPSLSSVTASSTSSSAGGAAWTSSEAGSTKVVLGFTSAYGSTTPERDTSPRVTSHYLRLAPLAECTTYHYAVVSRDAAGNAATSSDATFTTTGCEYQATPTQATSTTIYAGNTGTTTVTENGKTFSVTADATSTSLVIQVKAVPSDGVLASISRPSGASSEAGVTVFDVKAIIDETTILDSFDHPVTISYEYSDSDVSSIDESTLWLYHYHDGIWERLDDCDVDTAANTIECTTDSFSIFGLFGSQSTSSGSARSTGGGVIYCKPGETQFCRPSSPLATPSALCPKYAFTRALKKGMVGEDVRALQQLMNCLGFKLGTSGPGAPGEETNLFASRTFDAVVRFQEEHADEVLKPGGLMHGTGFFATYSQKKAALMTGE